MVVKEMGSRRVTGASQWTLGSGHFSKMNGLTFVAESHKLRMILIIPANLLHIMRYLMHLNDHISEDEQQ